MHSARINVWLKKVFQYSIILIFTIILLEIFSLILFSFLTEEKFEYITLENSRLERIQVIQGKMQGDSESSDLLYSFHPYIGYVGRKDVYPWSEKNPPFNEYGMLSVLGYRYPYEKRDSDFVIAVLGGSVAEIFANIGEKYLEKYANIDKNIVLISLATGGYKQPQQLFHLQYALLAGFEFDAILNIDGFNDLALAVDNFDNGINPLFPSGYHIGFMSKQKTGLDKKTVNLLSNYYALYGSELKLLSFVQKIPFRYSVFLNLLSHVWTKNNIQKIKQVEYKLSIDTQKSLTDEFRGPSFDQKRDKFEMVTKIWIESSKILHTIAEAHNLLYIHILQPNQYVEGSKVLSEHEKKVAFNLTPSNKWAITIRENYSYLVSAGEQLKKESILFYDLTMIFKNYTEDIYKDICCHFGERGNEIMAEHIAKILLNEINRVKK